MNPDEKITKEDIRKVLSSLDIETNGIIEYSSDIYYISGDSVFDSGYISKDSHTDCDLEIVRNNA